MGKMQDTPVNIRVKLSGLWATMLFIFAYVDIFAFYRSDFREEIAAGKVAGFDINQTFLLLTTIYILLPSLMVYLNLVLKPKISKILNIALAGFYALTIIAGAVGEWSYYIVGSLLEVVLLAIIIFTALKWPKV